jgi:hypothetical protein
MAVGTCRSEHGTPLYQQKLAVNSPGAYWHHEINVYSACITYKALENPLGLYVNLLYSHDRIMVTKSGPDGNILVPKHAVLDRTFVCWKFCWQDYSAYCLRIIKRNACREASQWQTNNLRILLIPNMLKLELSTKQFVERGLFLYFSRRIISLHF